MSDLCVYRAVVSNRRFCVIPEMTAQLGLNVRRFLASYAIYYHFLYVLFSIFF